MCITTRREATPQTGLSWLGSGMKKPLPGGGAGVPRSKETSPPLDPTVGLRLGPYGGPRGVGVSYERGTRVVRAPGPGSMCVVDRLAHREPDYS